jgi:Flp pilus assembly protein protease CpaA
LLRLFFGLLDMKAHRRGLCRASSHGKAIAMDVPSILRGESRTRLLQGIALGVVATLIIGFSWGGWVSGGTAKIMAATAETKGEMSVLVPLCVTQFMATDGALAKLKLTQYGHDDVVREFVKKVVDTDMDYSFARACASGVDDAVTKTAAKG